VPLTDDQLEVDTEREEVLLFRNAWNREGCGTADETHTFEALRHDRDALDRLAAMLASADAAELRLLVG